MRTRRSKVRSDPWISATTRSVRRECRRAERRWKKDKLQISYQIMIDTWARYQKVVKDARNKFFSNIITASFGNQRVLYQTLNAVLSASDHHSLTTSDGQCTQFLKIFLGKIASIRAQISSPYVTSRPEPIRLRSLDNFDLLSLSSLENLLSALKPSGSPVDPVPPHLLKETYSVTGPLMLSIINNSLSTGVVPRAFKHAVVQPVLKKPGLDTSVMSNFRPISKLPFLSKLLERAVFNQIMSHLDDHGLMDPFQSGFRSLHSTESAHLRVFNDILLTLDSGSNVLLVLLDLSAAFDTVDHAILLTRLNQLVGIQGTALDWFRSYFCDRTFNVMMGSAASPSAALTCGVPQGSILGPLLFNLYILPLGDIFKKHHIDYHFYADDCQLYASVKPNDSLLPLVECCNDVKSWLSENFLLLNDAKTEAIIFSPGTSQSPQLTLPFITSGLKNRVTNLGVVMDAKLKMDIHVNQVVKTCYYHLRRLSKVKPILKRHHLHSVVHAFITSRLDYSNSVLYGISSSTLARLQLVQNAAARFLTGTRQREHITPVLANLHWLPIHLRIEFKILVFVFKSLNNLAPGYLSELIHPYVPTRSLRSADQHLLHVPSSRCKSRGERAFSVCAPKLWNHLPLPIRLSSSLSLFKSRLKTHFYSLAFNSV
uniref:Reverse transcriptase domain-containing protein n=1 Tax=Nothobranchius furzeri TaxID=105023 RepID=A0A8C6LWY4_NOTFU